MRGSHRAMVFCTPGRRREDPPRYAEGTEGSADAGARAAARNVPRSPGRWPYCTFALQDLQDLGQAKSPEPSSHGGAMKSRKLCSIRIRPIGWQPLPEGDGHPQIPVHDDLHAARDRGPSRSEEPSAGEPALALLSRVGDDRFLPLPSMGAASGRLARIRFSSGEGSPDRIDSEGRAPSPPDLP